VEIEGLTELERSGLKDEDLEMYDAIKRMLTVHTYLDVIKFRDSLNARQKRIIVRVVYRLKDKGCSNIDTHLGTLAELSTNINHLDKCLSLPTDEGFV
jgi:hypothetical protein